MHKGPAGIEVLAIPEDYGGLSTPATPEGVAYYLDQGQRCQAVGAFSAAITMYRAALEQLLHEQGYEQRMLGPKIQALLDDASPPAWRDEMDPDYLRVIKDLGNAAIHANDGDIEKQHAFEPALVREVDVLFAELLDRIYEQPARKSGRLSKLKQISGSFKN